LGDIIIGIDNDRVDSEQDLFKAIDKHFVGDKVTLKILRSFDTNDDGNAVSDIENISLKPIDVQVTLTQKPQPVTPMKSVNVLSSFQSE